MRSAVLRMLAIVVLGIVACVAAMTLPLWQTAWEEWRQRIPFERAAWIAAGTTDAEPQRTRMVDDLLRRTDFTGMTREQVTGMLGEPTNTEYFSDWDMVYYLGPERGLFGIDSEWLVLMLDAQGTVSAYRVTTD